MKLSAKAFFRRSLQALVAATSILLAAPSVDAAIYMDFGDFPGEATAPDHRNWSDILSFGLEVHRQDGAGTVTPGPVEFGAIRVKRPLGRSTPKLLEAVCTGKVLAKVVIHFTELSADGAERVHMAYELENVLITNYSVSGATADSGAGDPPPIEGLTLNYERARVIAIDWDGSKGGNVEVEWKVEEGE